MGDLHVSLELREKEPPPPGTLGLLAARVMFLDEDSDCLAAPNVMVNMGSSQVVEGGKHGGGASPLKDWHPAFCTMSLLSGGE
jgi:hypothetical protein